MTTTNGRFDLTRWDEETYDDGDAAKLVAVANAKTFTGGLTGTSTTRLLQAITPGGSATYVGIELVEAELDGRRGTFVFRHSALLDGDGGDMRVDVLPGSGTGELAGLRGELAITMTPEREHTYVFTYELG